MAYTVSRLGQANATGDANALFLKVFGGEVLAAFKRKTVMDPLHTVRTIQNGKSAQFPSTWRATAAYHTPGNEITGGQISHNERVITIDDLLVSSVFLYDLDEAKNHYDYRSIYTSQMGEALAITEDQQLLQLVGLAARTSANITGADGGTQLTNALYGTDGATLVSGLFTAAQRLEEKNIDVNPADVHAVFKPAQYYLLAQQTSVMNKDWGGQGSIATANVPLIANIAIHKSNNVPSSNISSVSGTNNTYHGNFSTTVGVVFHKSAVGTVKLRDLAVESDRLVQYQGTLMVAKYAMGHGILRPEAAIELITA